jgi:tetratricopeptide (TPR) repeat protein
MTMKRFSLSILGALILLPAHARLLRADVVEQQVLRGIEQLYNVDFDAASRSFDAAIAADPSDPAGYFYRANVHLWSFLFDKRREQLGQFMSFSDRTIKVAEERISANPHDSRARLFLGMTYGYRAIAHARDESFTSAAISAKTCYDRLNEAIQGDRALYDGYLGLGLFHFMFGSIPKVAQFMAGLTGIKGDAKLGIQEIELTAARGTYFKNDARMIMALLKIYYLGDMYHGVRTLDELAGRYPRNVALLYALGSVYLDRSQPDKAVDYFTRVTRLGNEDFKTFTNLSYGRCGIAYFQKNDFAHAKGYLQQFLKIQDEKMLRNYAWYLLGICYDIGGNRDYALKSYDRAIAGASTASPEDRLARRRAQVFRSRPMTPADVQVIRALNSVSVGNNDDAIARGEQVLRTPGILPSQRAQANFAVARGHQQKGECDAAIASFKQALLSGSQEETWIAPFSYFHMAECYRKLGDNKKFQENLDRAGTFHGYDDEAKLRFKIERDVTLID